MRLRFAIPSDLLQMQQLYVDTIRAVCNQDYTEGQIAEWTSTVKNSRRWNDVMVNQQVVIAERNNKIIGFGTLRDSDYIDFFYIHKDFQRQGIANAILSQIEIHAKKAGTKYITSDVSITARPFFERKGFKVLREQRNQRNGVELINYKMAKAYD